MPHFMPSETPIASLRRLAKLHVVKRNQTKSFPLGKNLDHHTQRLILSLHPQIDTIFKYQPFNDHALLEYKGKFFEKYMLNSL